MILKVATYNLHNADGGTSLDGIAEEIASLAPDIIGVQEVDVCTRRSGKRDIFAELSGKSGMKYARFFPSIAYQGGQYGTAVLSRFPIVSSDLCRLDSANGEQRVMGRVTVLAPDGEVNFFNVHLALAEAVRALQFRTLEAALSHARPFILTGDFNTASLSEFDAISRMNAVNSEAHPTDTFKTGGRIDNIIVSDDCSILSSGLSQTPYSDHNMLFATIDYPTAPELSRPEMPRCADICGRGKSV